jgi:hypothetical protein
LEINFSQDAVLMLSSMNLPDGIQVHFLHPCHYSILKFNWQQTGIVFHRLIICAKCAIVS